MPKLPDEEFVNDEGNWTDKDITVHCGDCLKVLPTIKDVDLVFADPPFNIGYKYDGYNDNKPDAEYIGWCRQWLYQIYRCLKPTGSFWLAIGDKYVSELDIEAKYLGFIRRSWVIWHYTFGVNCTNKLTPSKTHLLYYTKSPKNFTFNKQEVLVPSARQYRYNDKRAKHGGRLPNDVWLLDSKAAYERGEAFQPATDTWFISRVCGTFKERVDHACQMPVDCLKRIVALSSHPGDLVVDPFAGSGTTLVACKLLSRKAIGIELSINYANDCIIPRLLTTKNEV